MVFSYTVPEMEGLHVLQVHQSYPPALGGIETHLRLLSEDLIRSGCAVTVLTCNRCLRTDVERRGRLTIIRLASPGKLLSMNLGLSVFGWLQQLRPDLIHIHDPYPLGDIAWLATSSRIPTVVTWHSDIVRQKRLLKLFYPLQQRFLSQVERIIATSRDYAESSEQLRGHQERVRVVPLGVSAADFEASKLSLQQVARLRREHGERIVLGVGRLVGYKGWEYLIEAMRRVEGRAVIIGQGPRRTSLGRLIRRSGLKDRVILTGPVAFDELLAWYHACNVFVLPSIGRNEAFGLVQLEAMLCGKPVISTAVGTGVESVNQDGITGLVIPPKDGMRLAEAINQLLGDKALAEYLGWNGRERAVGVFSQEQCSRQVLAIYREVLDSHGRR
jgi:glycosyltransferase involved in cell wall biosynthesis